MNRFLATLVALWFSALLAGASGLSPVGLLCDGAENPLGIDSDKPRMSWRLEAPAKAKDKKQTAYQIVVATTRDRLEAGKADLWDSGKVASDETLDQPYAGKALTSSQRVFWRIRVWDEMDSVSDWSEPATWTMGLLRPEDWSARWIGDPASEPNAETGRKTRGYHATEAAKAEDAKWVQVDLGSVFPLGKIRLHPVRGHGGHDVFGFPVRFRVEVADDEAFSKPVLVRDQTHADFAPPSAPVEIEVRPGTKARFVRVTATRLWKRDTAFCFALSQIEVRPPGQMNNMTAGAKVTYLDSVEQWGWGAASLTDGTVAEGALTPSTSPTLRMRREFTVRPGLQRALVHFCGLGQAVLTANGRATSEDKLGPPWTKYDKTCLYETRDLTGLMKPGQNTLGLDLAGGMYRVTAGRYTKFKGSFGPLRAIVHLRLEYADGTVETVASDGNWKATSGPTTFSCVYGGEDFDARLDPPGWNRTGFDTSAWRPATVMDGPGGSLRGASCSSPPLRWMEEIRPVDSKVVAPDTTVYDFGQNAAVMIGLSMSGPRGSRIKVIPAELLGADGRVDRRSCGGGEASWNYTLAGNEDGETWVPAFFYHGCRYLQVQRIPDAPGGARPRLRTISARVVQSSSPAAGEFSCSSKHFNQTRGMIRWAQRSNMVSVLTDCPHRERLGWLEQYHLHGPALRYEWDLGRLYAKTMQDMADSQTPEGLVPDIAPEYTVFGDGFRDSPEWGCAAVLVPWQQYEWTGSKALLEAYYPVMRKYVDYLGTKAKDHILDHGLGDWYDIGPNPPGYAQLTPKALTATAFYHECVRITAEAAAMLGRVDETKELHELADAIRAAFNTTFFDEANVRYATGSQTAQAIPLALGLVDEARRERVVAALVADLEKSGLTAGDIGHRYLLRALADAGRSDLVFALHRGSSKPGYGFILKQGATSLTEAWDAGRSSSHNHFMLGHITEWFYHDLVGIQPDSSGSGFKKIVIRPQPVAGVASARATYRSVRGLITCRWTRDGDRFVLDVVIPPNTSGTVHLPGAKSGEGTSIGSGTHHFECKMNNDVRPKP